MDMILTLFTAYHGKIRAVGKGIRRPGSRSGGHLDIPMHSTLQIARGRSLDIVTQSETIDAFVALRDDLTRTALAFEVIELIDRVTEEGHEDRALFEFLVATLHRVADDPDPDLAVRFWEMGVLERAGYRPNLHTCVQCDHPLERVDSFCSATAGGILCPTCGARVPGARPIGANAFAMARLLQNGDYATACRVRRDEDLRRDLEAFLRAQIAHVLDRNLASTAFLNRVRSMT